MRREQYFQFQPDLIIEATSVCDRACAGCYAPNVISKNSTVSLYERNPELFLNSDHLEAALRTIHSQGKAINTLSIRGGEPSRHPKIVALLKVAKLYAKEVFLETHGRWLLMESLKEYQDLIQWMSKLGIYAKISFDRMHGLSCEQLKDISDVLGWHAIPLFVAITESSEEEFQRTRSLCSWISDDRIVFQLKAKALEKLIQPQYGVINIKGALKSTLNVQSKFDNPSTSKSHSERNAI